mgnify:CR=1 FL=1
MNLTTSLKITNFVQVLPVTEYITTDKNIAAGVPVFKGTRVAIQTMFDYLEESSLDEFLQGFPSVERKNAESVIELAAAKLLSDTAA